MQRNIIVIFRLNSKSSRDHRRRHFPVLFMLLAIRQCHAKHVQEIRPNVVGLNGFRLAPTNCVGMTMYSEMRLF
jgi:hypothetical protein